MMGKCFVHQATYQGERCPICEAAEDRQGLIDRAIRAERQVVAMRAIFQLEVVELANLAQMVDPIQAQQYMERVYAVFAEGGERGRAADS